MEELHVELMELPIGELVENTGQIPGVPTNPRKISKEKFNALCESIRKSPEMKSLDEVKVYPYDGKYVVISGNHRYRAYKKLKWEDVRRTGTGTGRRRSWKPCKRNGGGQIVKVDTSNKGRSEKVKRLDYNPIIKVPIKGV